MSTIKITELPSATSITSDDLLVMVDSGNPYVTKKISWRNIDSPQNGTTYARKDGNWVDIYNTANLQLSMGTYSEINSYIPLSGEPIYDTTNKVVYIGDGSTVRGNLIGNVSKFAKIDNTVSIPTGGSYTTPLSVTLNSLNSIWEITSSFVFNGVDGDNEVSISIAPTISNLSYHHFEALTSVENGVSTFSVDISEVLFNILSNQTCSVKLRHIVQLTGSSATFGAKFKENSGIFDAYATLINIIATRIS